MTSGFAFTDADGGPEFIFRMSGFIGANAGDIVYVIHDNEVAREGFLVTMVTHPADNQSDIFVKGDVAGTMGN